MIIRIIRNLFLVVLITIFQLAFINNLPTWFGQFNLIIVILIFSLEFGKSRKTIWWFLLVGFLFDIYSPLFFGFWLCFWPVVFLFAKFLSVNSFTNKSLYSFLGLGFFTTLFYYFFFHLIFYILNIMASQSIALFLLSKNFYINLLSSLIFNLLAIFVLFYTINFISDKLKPVFLFKK